MNRSFFNSPIAKTLVVILFVGALTAWALWSRHLPRPDEKNRVYHPDDGYSIIAPPEWTMSFETAEHTLTPSDKGWIKIEPIKQGYQSPSIMVHVRNPDPDPEQLKSKEGFSDGTFHGHPALVKDFRQHKYYAYSIVFKDRDKWFDICLTTPDYYDVRNSSWWSYLDSFRYEPQKAKKVVLPMALQDLKFSTTLPSDVPK